MAANTPDGFGWVSRVLHWLMALGIIVMLGLGTYIDKMQPSLANLWLFALHKGIGTSLLILVLIRLIWHRFSPPPPSLTAGIPPWQRRSARIAHLALYGLMLTVPLSGWIASSATGIDTVIFNRLTLPAIAPVSEVWEKAFFTLHGVLTKLLAATVLLHVAGALQHHFVHRDATLRRMLRG
jgi:cytochrome b561